MSFIIYDVSSSFEPKVYTASNLLDFSDRGYSFSGIKSCSGSSITLNYIGLGNKRIRCEGSNCPSSCVSIATCKKYKGNIVNDLCLICKSD